MLAGLESFGTTPSKRSMTDWMKARLAGVSLAGVWRNQLAGLRSARVNTSREMLLAPVFSVWSALTKPKRRFLKTGKPEVKPNWLRRVFPLSTPGLKTLFVALKALLLWYQYTSPWRVFVPDFVCTRTTAP